MQSCINTRISCVTNYNYIANLSVISSNNNMYSLATTRLASL